MSFRMRLLIAGALALGFGMGIAVGQNAPSETRGVQISPPTALDLTDEIDGVSGRQLRLRFGDQRGCRGDTARDRAFEEIAAAETVRHAPLP